ncbi:MAG: AraC family transcriptional regulator [Stellaceae bacterium]
MSESRDCLVLDEPQAGLQRLAARFYGHAYDPHRHECYAVGITDWGVQSFRYRGAERASLRGQVIVIHPDEPHDGHAGRPSGFAYRMLYLDPALVQRALGGAGTPPFVPEVVAADAETASILTEAFAEFPAPLEPLAWDGIVARLAEALARRGENRRSRTPGSRARTRVEAARAFLAAECHRPITSADLETVTGLDRFTLARAFRAVLGTSPHRYLVGRRLDYARALVMSGAGLADAAAAAGFVDQSHLTRQFKSRYGVTPGRWLALARPDTVMRGRTRPCA